MNNLLIEYADNEKLIEKIDNDITKIISNLKIEQEKLVNANNLLRQKILENMEQNGDKKYENDFISITYIAPTVKKTFDSKKFKEEQPETYEQYLKTTDVKSSVRIKVKQQPTLENKKENNVVLDI